MVPKVRLFYFFFYGRVVTASIFEQKCKNLTQVNEFLSHKISKVLRLMGKVIYSEEIAIILRLTSETLTKWRALIN